MQAERKEPLAGRMVQLVALLLIVLLIAACGTGGEAIEQPPGEQLGVAVVGATETATTLPTPDPPTATPDPPTATPTPTATPRSGGASAGDPYTPELGNTGYDVQHYTLELAIDPAAPHVEGTAIIEALTTIERLGQISLDFVGFDIGYVMVDEMVAPFRREDDKLWIEFPAPLLEVGTPFTVTVGYGGQPVQEDSPYIHYADHLGLIFPGNNTFYTLSEPDGARYWFPANDHLLDKASFRIELTVPAGMAAISNGQLVNSWVTESAEGEKVVTFAWEQDDPMATYLALAAGGHYLRADEASPSGVPLIYYYFPELEEEFFEAVDVTGEALDWMSEQFGAYPFDSYGQATYYALGISMEMQSMTLLSFQMLDERTVVHELAHSWFGNWVGLETWGDTWFKEGFATYVEILWLARDDPAQIETLVAELEAEVAEKGNDYPINRPPPERLMSFDAYHRGALVVHALHEEVGDEAFYEGLRTFFARYGGGTADFEEFQSVMEEAAGYSLDPFFSRWLAE